MSSQLVFPIVNLIEIIFPSLGGDKIIHEECIVHVDQPVPKEQRELTWNISILSHLDPRTS